MHRPALLLLAVVLVTYAESEIRPCRFVPGQSVPAVMPADLMKRVTAAVATLKPPASSSVPREKTAVQLRVFSGLSDAVRDHYVYDDFGGNDWNAITARYRSLIEKGLSDDDFYASMEAMVRELGDGHSYFQSPATVRDEAASVAGQYELVGIGALFKPIEGTDHAVIMSLFAGSPAAEAGLLPHDVLLAVDGGPIRDPSGKSHTLGVAGSKVLLTIRQPGQPPRKVTLTRRKVAGILPIDSCLIPKTRIGYIFLPTLMDKTMGDQVREALRKLTAEGPLQGLILDNRLNGGGLGKVSEAIMGLFASGLQGHFVSRAERKPLELKAENIGGSQTVPMVVLVDADTVSNGEIMSGVLRLAGRARIIGGRTRGNVEQLRKFDFPADGSRAWIAAATFEPRGLSGGVWEGTGIIPDVLLPTRWDLFTEANDPALARAVELLRK